MYVHMNAIHVASVSRPSYSGRNPIATNDDVLQRNSGDVGPDGEKPETDDNTIILP